MTPFAPIAAESAMQRARRRWAGIVTWMRLGSVTPPRDRRRDWLLVAVVGIPMVFNAIALWPEVAQRVPNVNDDAFHQLMIRSASEAIHA